MACLFLEYSFQYHNVWRRRQTYKDLNLLPQRLKHPSRGFARTSTLRGYRSITAVGKTPALSLYVYAETTMVDACVNPTKNSPNYLPCREKACLFLVYFHRTPRRLTQASTLHKTHLIIYLVGKRPAFSLSIPSNITMTDAGVNPTRLSVL